MAFRLSFIAGIAAGPLGAQVIQDDFGRADGPIDGDGWTSHSGLWRIEGGVLRAGPSTAGVEQHLYAGSPATRLPIGPVSVSVDLAFRNPDAQPVGRHAGLLLCMDPPGARSASSGYLVWYIDRLEDRGINLTRRDRGVFTKLASGTFSAEQGPPGNLRVEIEGPTIRVFADDVEVIALDDETYRGGHFGLWTWDGAAQDVEFDDYRLEVRPDPLVPCFAMSPPSAVAGVDVTFDAACTQATGTIASYTWDFGDGGSASGAVVEHTYLFPDNYVVTLTVEDTEGNVAAVERIVPVTDSLLKPDFADDFDRAAGPVDGWLAFPESCENICWDIAEGGKLHGASSGEIHIWAGDPPGLIQGDVTIDFRIEFGTQPLDGVGRHAGVFFFARDPVSRWNTTSYNVWWIDRPQDFGMGLLRWDPAIVPLQLSRDTRPDLRDPPLRWTIAVEGPRIRVWGDAALVLDVEDDTLPREGHFGFWAYSNGQDVLIDDVSIRSGVFPPEITEILACAQATPAQAIVGEEILFDASCSRLPDGLPEPVYRWDFGDGATATGQTAAHAYAFGDRYTVTLSIEPEGAPAVTAEITVDVAEVAELPIVEDFSQPAGPVPGWTVTSGDWSIDDDGALLVATQGAEAHIWYGDPPVVIGGDVRISFDVIFEAHNPAEDPIGKHAGAFFFGREPISRWDNAAYDVWWIDREQDFGLGLHRWPLQFLSPGTCPSADVCAFPDFVSPPERWRIEIDGPRIRVLGDGELLVDVEDTTRRFGHFGFWAYSNGQRVRFDNLCIESDERPCSPASGKRFVRGDVNADAAVNISDASYLLNYLFLGGPDPTCAATADANADGAGNISDASFLLNYLFLGGPDVPAPNACGETPFADSGVCASYAPCP